MKWDSFPGQEATIVADAHAVGQGRALAVEATAIDGRVLRLAADGISMSLSVQ